MSRIRLAKPGASKEQAAPEEEVHLASNDLEEELEIACLDAMRGDPPGPALEARLVGVCRSVLNAYGHEKAKIRARSDSRGTGIQILLYPGTPRVQTLNLGMSGA